MRQATLANLWFVVGVALFLFLLNSISAAYGWPFKIPGITPANVDRYAVALHATPPGLLGLAAVLGFGALHVRRSDAALARHRLPPPFRLNDPGSLFLHAVQVSAFVILPVAALTSLSRKYLNGTFCRQTSGVSADCGVSGYVRVGNGLDHFTFVPANLAFKSRAFIYQGGPDYWPFWTPFGITLLWLIVIAFAIWFSFELFRDKPEAMDD